MRHIDAVVSIDSRHYVISRKEARRVEAWVKSVVKDALENEEPEWISAEEVFPDLLDPIKRPANYLRGIRGREGLTQTQLAKKVGMKQSHISEMERYKRPIGKDVAKRLAAALNCNWRNMISG